MKTTAAIRAAIYARKSNDEGEKVGEDKSVARQIAHSREFIKRKGWRLAGDEFIFSDDGISGAEFKNRESLNRLLALLRKRDAAPFDVLVISEVSRIGRDMRHTSAVLHEIIAEKGVHVWTYLDERELPLATLEDEVMLNLKGYGAAKERQQTVQRTRDAALKIASAGRNSGGRCFGYDNEWLMPDGTKQPGLSEDLKPPAAKTLYKINETQAGVVRGIYQAYADGHGSKMICYALNGNAEQAVLLKRYFAGRPPQPPQRKNSVAWSYRTIVDILRNPRYLGVIPFGAKVKNYIGGTARVVRTGKEQFFSAPHLRIIDEKLAAAVKRRVEAMAKIYTGAPRRGDEGRSSKYLLSGVVRCSCGAAMIVSGAGSMKGRKVRPRYYICSARSNKGAHACSNTMRPRLHALDHAVLEAIGHQISPQHLATAAKRAAEIIRAKAAVLPNRAKLLQQELKKAEAEQARFVEAIGTGGGEIPALVKALAQAEQRCIAMRAELVELDSPATLDELADRRMVRQLTERAAQWRELLVGNAERGREALRALLAGPITFHPEQSGYRLKGATKLGALTMHRVKDETRREIRQAGD